MKFAAAFCVMLSAAAAPATAESPRMVPCPEEAAQQEKMQRLPLLERDLSIEEVSLIMLEPASGFDQTSQAADFCRATLASRGSDPEDAATRQCLRQLLGP